MKIVPINICSLNKSLVTCSCLQFPSNLNNGSDLTRHGLYKVMRASIINIHPFTLQQIVWMLSRLARCSKQSYRFFIRLKFGHFAGHSRGDKDLECSSCHVFVFWPSERSSFHPGRESVKCFICLEDA